MYHKKVIIGTLRTIEWNETVSPQMKFYVVCIELLALQLHSKKSIMLKSQSGLKKFVKLAHSRKM